jgi:hypothetical protein
MVDLPRQPLPFSSFNVVLTRQEISKDTAWVRPNQTLTIAELPGAKSTSEMEGIFRNIPCMFPVHCGGSLSLGENARSILPLTGMEALLVRRPEDGCIREAMHHSRN